FPQAMMISTPTRAASSSSPLQSSFTKWHNRLGHPSIKKLRSLTSKLPSNPPFAPIAMFQKHTNSHFQSHRQLPLNP
ncbi:hypothetical protein U1Q18_009592, partial [Sarracenia purpurea var. burkii]